MNKKKVLFVHAIDHASKCVLLQQTHNEGNNDVAAGTFRGSKKSCPGRGGIYPEQQ